MYNSTKQKKVQAKQQSETEKIKNKKKRNVHIFFIGK